MINYDFSAKEGAVIVTMSAASATLIENALPQRFERLA
jgi:hypothetical protein